MEISAKKIKLMTSNTSGIKKEIKIKGQKLKSHKLSSVVSDEGPKPGILSRMA